MKRILALILCVFTVICAASLASCDLLQSVGDISALITEFETNTNILDNFSDISAIALKNNLGNQQESSLVESFEQNLKTIDDVVAFESALFATAKVLENESVRSIVGEYFEEGYTLEYTEGDIDTYKLISDEGYVFKLQMTKDNGTDKYSLLCEENEEVFLFSEIVKTADESKGTMDMEIQVYYSHPEALSEGIDLSEIIKWQFNYAISLKADGIIHIKYGFNASPDNIPQSIFEASHFKGQWKTGGANDIYMDLLTTVESLEEMVVENTAESTTVEKTLAQRLISERVAFSFDKFDCEFEFSCASFDESSALVVKNGQLSYVKDGESYEFDFNTEDMDLKLPDFTAFDK